MSNYDLVQNLPVAYFYYKGSHSHPVRRTVLIVDQDRNHITGYELREGNEVRLRKNAPIKTYSRAEIARIRNLDARRPLRRNAKRTEMNRTTLNRQRLNDFIFNGA